MPGSDTRCPAFFLPMISLGFTEPSACMRNEKPGSHGPRFIISCYHFFVYAFASSIPLLIAVRFSSKRPGSRAFR